MRRGDGLYLRGSTWRLDFYHEGKRHIVTLGRNISKTVAREIASVSGRDPEGEAGIGKKPKDIALKKAVELYLAGVGAIWPGEHARFQGVPRGTRKALQHQAARRHQRESGRGVQAG